MPAITQDSPSLWVCVSGLGHSFCTTRTRIEDTFQFAGRQSSLKGTPPAPPHSLRPQHHAGHQPAATTPSIGSGGATLRRSDADRSRSAPGDSQCKPAAPCLPGSRIRPVPPLAEDLCASKAPLQPIQVAQVGECPGSTRLVASTTVNPPCSTVRDRCRLIDTSLSLDFTSPGQQLSFGHRIFLLPGERCQAF